MIRIENPDVIKRIRDLGLVENDDGDFRTLSGRRTYSREAIVLIALEDKPEQRHDMLERLKCIVTSGVVL